MRGLIGDQGNVQDAEGNWLKQIFFSGVVDTKEPNSHTWLVIGGKPYDAVLGTLHAAGYQGWLVVEAEQDPAVAPSYAYAKKGYETLRRVVDRLNSEATP